MDLRSRVLVEIHVERTDCVLIGEDADGAHAPQPTINYSVEIPTWSTHTQRRRLSARRAARMAG